MSLLIASFTSSARAARPGRLLPLLALLFVSALLSASGRVAAATLNVPAQYATIQAAVTAAQSGDTVVVADGTYSGAGNRDIDFGGKGLTVRSASGDPARTVIDCGGSASANHRGFYLHSGETGAVISGFTIKNGYEATDSGGGVYGGTLTKCVITGNFSGGNGGGVSGSALTDCTISSNTAASGGGASSSTLTGCTISGNTASGNGGGVNLQYPGTIINCVIASNTANSGGGVYSNIGTMTNCTVTGNTAGSGGGFYTVRYASTVTNCIFYGDTGGEISVLIDGGNLDHCNVQGGYPGVGNINADPLFVSAPGDLHLRAGSPCIGAGAFHYGLTTDKDGKSRPDPPTIGTYEGAGGVAGGRTHLLWNNADGRVMLWSVAQDGSFTVHGFGPYADNAPLQVHTWSATALATGADGRSYVLWNNTDGRVMLWTMDDAGSVSDAAYFDPYTDNAPQNKWSATAVSVGPDNVVHLLWNNTDGRVMLWNNATADFTLAGYGPYTDDSVGGDPAVNKWRATALATGPDNVSRILWNNTDHRVMLWDVAQDFSFSLAGYGPYTDDYVPPDPGNFYNPTNLWSAAAVSVGPDNVTHLLWRNADLRAMFWNVASDFSFTLAGYGPYTDNAPQNLWLATALATGPDNLNHFLWDNTDNRAMLWGVDNAFSFTVAGYGPYTDDFVSLDPRNLWSATAVSAGP